LFKDDRVEDIKKAALVASYLRGPAQTWVTLYLRQFLGDGGDESLKRMFSDWLEFKEKLRQFFAVAKEPLIAERKI
jgi:hypothetical protein